VFLKEQIEISSSTTYLQSHSFRKEGGSARVIIVIGRVTQKSLQCVKRRNVTPTTLFTYTVLYSTCPSFWTSIRQHTHSFIIVILQSPLVSISKTPFSTPTKSQSPHDIPHSCRQGCCSYDSCNHPTQHHFHTNIRVWLQRIFRRSSVRTWFAYYVWVAGYESTICLPFSNKLPIVDINNNFSLAMHDGCTTNNIYAEMLVH
jgi:hypothetical protein